ncbi:hypothetical protein C8J56DRAFT_546760 [Mycena floridula]|nr:hypothetical protein C8J56DRAFT_546760 [Mycena floridula]
MSSAAPVPSTSTSTFLTALVFNGAVFAAQLVVFTLLKPYFKRIYEPRAINNQIHSLSYLLWPIQIAKADYRAIIKANGLDAYFFVRFLRMLVKIFFPIWIISWATLIPLTAINSHVGNNDGLDRLVFGNVEPTKQLRFIGHICCAFLFTAWVFYNIKREMSHFIITRQHHLIDSIHSKSVQANTVLITGIPAKYLNQDALRKTYGALPGGVKKIWINRDLKTLPEIYERRLAACNKLEAAETKLVSAATQAKAKALKNGQESKSIDRDTIERPTHKLGFLGLFGKKVDSINWAREEIRTCTALLDEGVKLVQSADAADARNATGLRGGGWDEKDTRVEENHQEDAFTKKEPTASAAPGSDTSKQNLEAPTSVAPGSTPLRQNFAHQVSETSQHVVHQTSQFSRQTAQQASAISKQAAHLTQSAAAAASSLLSKKGEKEYPPLNSAFITFNRQIAAHLAVQALAHHEPYRMSGRYIELSPEDVIWGNLGLNPYEMKVRLAISWAITIATIVLWSIPVAFVGIISNVHYICALESWLAWLCKLPDVVVGIISGILPPVMLAVLMMLLPIFLRLLARFEGIPQISGCELSLMHRFFSFQVVHSFLVMSLSAGIIAALPDLIKNPGSIPSLLATKLPSASTFFLTYTLLQLASTAGGFLQIVALIIYYVKLFLLGSTPRSIWGLKYGKRSIAAWGTLWPSITVLVVITLGYSIISPVINGIACVTFVLLFLLYKYLFLWVMDQSPVTDTGGMFFPRAIQHIFVGLYVQQVVLCALFFLARNGSGKPSAVPEGALMVVLIIFTAAFQMIMSNSYDPLMHALPLTLADKMHVTEEVPVVDPVGAPSNAHGEDLELAPVNSGTRLQGMEAEHLKEEREGSGFAHPAIVANSQRTVWIPTDKLGWAAEEEQATREAGVHVVTGHGATLNDKGTVEVDEGPGIPGLD